MRSINKAAIHTEAVKLGRNSKNGMKKTADMLAVCNVDKQIDFIVSRLKAEAWLYEDSVIIAGCASRLWMDFCQAAINIK